MVNGVLTSPSLLWGNPCAAGQAPPVSTHVHDDRPARACLFRSFGARLPLAFRAPDRVDRGHRAGQAGDQLVGGRTAAPVPSFVGPALSAHLDDFGRYPANKGIEPFRAAVAQWLGRRYKLTRPVDPEHRSSGAQWHARRPVPRRDCRQTLGDTARRQAGHPDSQSILCRLRRRCARRRLRARLLASDAQKRFSA